MSEVIQLANRVPGFPVGGNAELADFLDAWSASLREGDLGRIRTVILLLEDYDQGGLRTISQGAEQLDVARLCGLLTIAAQRSIMGGDE